jgi:[ribosomal protein S5]-alanine N-acetyltransferase
MTIVTERLRLVPATVELVDADLEGRLAVAPDWPPEHHDEDVLRFTRDQLADPANAGWWLHYFVWTAGDIAVGTGGFVGPPGDDGTVEVGYSVVPSYQRRGIASEATRGLIEAARERGAKRVIAHTLPELVPSIGVLVKLGFTADGEREPGVLRFALDLP